MKVKSRIIAFVLAAAIALCMIPVMGFAGGGGYFSLVVETSKQLVLEPIRVFYKDGDTVKTALKDSGHTFTGIDEGFITAIDGVEAYYCISDNKGNYDLNVGASTITALRFSESYDPAPTELIQLIDTMAAYNSMSVAKIDESCKSAYDEAYAKYIGISADDAKTAAEKLSSALKALDENTGWDGSTITEPSVVSGVYQIGTAEELAWFAALVNGTNGLAKNIEASAELTSDIDLSYRDWTPIGNTTSLSSAYKGIFDGKGYEIRGLYINSDSSSTQRQALFGFAYNAQIKNLTVSGNVANTKASYTAGVIAYAQSATVTNVHNNCDVTGNGTVGGVIGYDYTSSSTMAGSVVTECSNSGDITGASSTVGGVIGSGLGSAVTSCFNLGNIKGTTNVSGVVGYLNYAKAYISDCYNIGTVTVTQNTTTTTAGGVVSVGNMSIKISGCYNVGEFDGAALSSRSDYLIGGSVEPVVTKCVYLSEKADTGSKFGDAVSKAQLISAEGLSDAYIINLHDDYHEQCPILKWEAGYKEFKKLPATEITSVSLTESANSVISVKYGTSADTINILSGDVVLTSGDASVKVPAKWKCEGYDKSVSETYNFEPVFEIPVNCVISTSASIPSVSVTVREKGAADPAVTHIELLAGTSSEYYVTYGKNYSGLPGFVSAVVDGKAMILPVRWTEDASYSNTVPGVYKFTCEFIQDYELTGGAEYPSVSVIVKEMGFITKLSIQSPNGTTSAFNSSFDESEHSYTITVLDSVSTFKIAKIEFNELLKDNCTFKVLYKNASTGEYTESKLYNSTETTVVQNVVASGGSASDVVIRAYSGSDYQDYNIHIDRSRTLVSLGVTSEIGTVVSLSPEFTSSRFSYEMTVPDTYENIVISPASESSYEGYKIEVNGVEYSQERTTVPLSTSGDTVILISVKKDGDASSTVYTLTVHRALSARLTFSVTPSDSILYVKDENGNRILPDESGDYVATDGSELTYTVTRSGYVGITRAVEAHTSLIDIKLNEVEENILIDKTIESQWPSFRGSDDNNGAVSVLSPKTADEAELYWAVKYGSGYGGEATGSPIIVDGYLIFTASSSIYKVDRFNGEIVAKGTMSDSSNFNIIPPTYADGMIFVGLKYGTIQAFNADTLESLWVYHDELEGQPNSPIMYKNGYVYTGFWNSETANANFVCLSATDEDPNDTMETKLAAWTYTQKGGFYWAGAYVDDSFVLVGTDDGDGSSTSQTSNLISFDPNTGEVIDIITGLNGDIRSSVCYDEEAGECYFTTKGGSFYVVGVNRDGTFNSDADEIELINEAGGRAMSTSTPVVYNGRAYIGIAGSGQFSKYSGHAIAVIDIESRKVAYTCRTLGYPQVSGLLTDAYVDEDGYAYIYFIDNYTPGQIRVIKDRPGETTIIDGATEVNSGNAYNDCANVLFTPAGAQAQYAICSPIIDEYGTLYFKNDSAYMMALGSRITGIEVETAPNKLVYAEGDVFKSDGMKVYAQLSNGLKREITDYVTFSTTPLTSDDTDVTITYDDVMYHDKLDIENGNEVGVSAEPLWTYVDIYVLPEADAAAVNNAIDLINDIGEVSLSSGETIDAAKSAYEQLDDELKEYVSNYDSLKEAETLYNALVADKELNDIKSEAKEELLNYTNESLYREEQKAELSKALSDGINAIENAVDTSGVSKALSDAKLVIDKIKTDSELTLEETKKAAIEELVNYKIISDYRTEQQNELRTIINIGTAAINSADSVEEVAKILYASKSAIDKIKTASELAEEEKTVVAEDKVSPPTGDSFAVTYAIVLLPACLFVMVYVLKKRKFDR